MMWTTSQIRQTFLEFFHSKSHQIVASAPIVIKDDPTLMFTNAGMNQFKGVFLGNAEFESKRVADSQKCLRVSGKHNDLEEVGKDHYHHTMFEMLGNWSFGDYFKEAAIAWAWELLTKVYKLDPNRIYVSVFNGDESMKLAIDSESRDIWSKWINSDRIMPFGRKENFWEMGETGPCGPCSEIHYDMRSDSDRALIDGRTLVNQDHPDVIEIWNLVFMEFNRLEDGSLVNLKNKHIDTGMGLERLARALQATNSNYAIDLFKDLISKIEDISGLAYKGSDGLSDVAFRVIADHIRAVAFCIADGQLPANNGAGYVVRRILRRAIRYGYSQLNINEPFMFKVAEKLIEMMGHHYPELTRNAELVVKVITEEEKTFLATLDKGLDRLARHMEMNQSRLVDGEFAFELYDTFGFPIDLTQLIAAEKDFTVDMKGFDAELERQKNRSRAASKMEYGDWTVLNDGPNSVFIGYDTLEFESIVAKYRKATVKNKESFQVVLLQTPFYAESGGQIGDSGVMMFDQEVVIVYDTKRENNEIIHYLASEPKTLCETVKAKVNISKRSEIAKNHSATHLLHQALRAKLGNHVEQKGSMVSDSRLRFDFSHFEKIGEQDFREIEDHVKRLVESNLQLEESRNVPINEAKAMGAMALFGEKYGNEVRVIKFGDSVELCGGTHVNATREIGGFKLLSETGIAAGIRRVEAISGSAYTMYIESRLAELEQIEKILGSPANSVQALQKLQAENRELSKSLETMKANQLLKYVEDIKKEIFKSEFDNLLVKRIDGFDGKSLKDMAFQVTSEMKTSTIVLGGISDEKVNIVVAIGPTSVYANHTDAISLIKSVSELIDGGGGGQKFLATAGGKNKQGLDKALADIKIALSN